MIVCHSALLLSGQIVSQSLDPRALQDALCIYICLYTTGITILYIHLYFNTVPQIVEEQHCFSNTLEIQKYMVEINCTSSKITPKTLFCSTRLSKSKLSSVQKGSCIVQLSLLQFILAVRLVVRYWWGVVSLTWQIVLLVHLVIAEILVDIVDLNCQPFSSVSPIASSSLFVSIIAIVIIIGFSFFDLCVKDPLLVAFVSTL